MTTEITPRLVNSEIASKYLAISERKLWSMTKENRIPAVKIDRCIRYDVADLDAFIAEAKGTREENKL